MKRLFLIIIALLLVSCSQSKIISKDQFVQFKYLYSGRESNYDYSLWMNKEKYILEIGSFSLNRKDLEYKARQILFTNFLRAKRFKVARKIIGTKKRVELIILCEERNFLK